jgi:DNA adenine methylase
MSRESQNLLWSTKPPKQFLKWIGNKQRFAAEIASYAPEGFNRYFEPFVGSGAVLGTIAPAIGLAGDNHPQLIGMWKLLQAKPESLLEHYKKCRHDFLKSPKTAYERTKASYNASPNPYDLLFLCRSCYGGVVRFRRDGYMSTPVGPHRPISSEELRHRMDGWRGRLRGTQFSVAHFSETMQQATAGDLVYCDPPYSYSQAILYGSQTYRIDELWQSIDRCRRVGAKVILSLDGKKKSGKFTAQFDIPDDLFQRQIMINCGRSMLRRFQRAGETLEDEVVHDRLLLTW